MSTVSPLREFNPVVQLPDAGLIVVVGRTNSGKSVCIQNLARFYSSKVKLGVVFSGSRQTCRDWVGKVPSSFIHFGLPTGKLDSIYRLLEAKVDEGKPLRSLVVIDDMAYQKRTLQGNPTFLKIAYNCRNVGMICILSIQYCKDIGPDYRSQTRLVFACKESQPQTVERLYEAFNPVFRTLRDFEKVFRACTTDNEVLVMDNSPKESAKPEDSCFFWRPQFPVPGFKVNPDGFFWKFDRVRGLGVEMPAPTESRAHKKRDMIGPVIDKIYLPKERRGRKKRRDGDRS